jgi:hypothetical protein
LRFMLNLWLFLSRRGFFAMLFKPHSAFPNGAFY